MTRKTIGELSAVATADPASFLEIEQAGASHKIAVADLLTAVAPGGIPDLGPVNDRLDHLDTLAAELVDSFGTTTAATAAADAADAAREAAVVAQGRRSVIAGARPAGLAREARPAWTRRRQTCARRAARPG